MQNYAKELIVNELTNKLDTKLGIGRLYFRPFNTVALDSLYVLDKQGEKILLADNVSASIDLFELMKQNIVISSARLSDFEAHISKQSNDSTLNIQFIIDAFQSKDDKPKAKIELKLNAINISSGQFYYDVLDEPKISGKFDKNHIAVRDFNTKLALKSLQSDSLNIQVRKLELKEQSGFEINNLVGRFITQGDNVSIKGFELLLPDSKIEFAKLDLVLPKAQIDSTKQHDHINDRKLDFSLSESYISPRDISAFVPELRSFNDRVYIKADISGLEHSLKMSNLTLLFGNKLKLVANAEVIDWLEDSDTYVLATIDELTVAGSDIERIANIFSKKEVHLPKGILEQKNISFQGDVSGYLNQLTAFGSLDTDNGIVRTDVLFGFDKKEKAFSYAKGKVYTNNFELGKFLGNDNLGNTSFSIAVNIAKPLYKDLEGTVKGEIHSFQFKDYTYEDILLDVHYGAKRVEGSLAINDEHGQLHLDGMLDMANKELPILNVTAKVENVQFDKLQLVPQLENSYLSLNIDVNLEGANPDNVEGYIAVNELEFIRNQKTFALDKLLIQASGQSNDSSRKIVLQSDIINGTVEGESSINDIGNSFKTTLQTYLPALLPKEIKATKYDNNFKFRFDINNTEILSDILKLPVVLYEPASIIGYYNDSDNRFKLEVQTPNILAGGMKIRSGYVLAENNGEVLSSLVKARIEGKNQIQNDITIKSLGKDDEILTEIGLVNNSKARAEGTFKVLTEFDHLGKKDGLRTKITINESQLLLNNINWKLEESSITFEKQLIDVDNFWLYSEDGQQELKIHGKYSKTDPSNVLKTQLRDMNLEYIFETLAIDALKFGGAASGDVFLSSIDEKPYANTNLKVKDFKFNDTELGNLDLFSELNDETKEVILDGEILTKENKSTKVNGIIDPVNQSLSIHFDADSIDIGFLHQYAQSIFDKISGRGTGHVHLHGDFSNVTVEGVANIIDGKIGIKFLNTDYSFSDVIYLREGLIYFNDIEFVDKYGNIAFANGKVVHDYFRDIMYHIELNASNFLVYNATEAHNPIFYGQVFGSGKGVLGGDEQEINIDINMQTQENTLVRMNFMEDEISEYSFITYKEPVVEEETVKKVVAAIVPKSDMQINMNFYIDATPDATFELLMDPVGGDILRGSGSGAMQFIWSSKLDPKLYGTFNVNRGSYNFTFQRIMEKKFSIQDGSTIQFRGDPFQANLDVNAIYKITASLSDLDNDLVRQSGQASVPVQCVLNLTGPLRQPNVGLDINFPTVNADVERQIKSYMDTEDMINRQVTYLLLLSKFYTPDAGNVANPSSDFAVVASATLSNQLTKIVSQIDDRWQLGTHIRMSDAELTNTEVELLLSSQLLNDRLLINGNFGYRDDPFINKDAVITDIDIEFLLNRSGTWRLKAYNHYNEKFYYLQDNRGIQTQGVGILYRRDFDKLKELWTRKKKHQYVPNNGLHHVLPDSTRKGSALSDFVRIKDK